MCSVRSDRVEVRWTDEDGVERGKIVPLHLIIRDREVISGVQLAKQPTVQVPVEQQATAGPSASVPNEKQLQQLVLSTLRSPELIESVLKPLLAEQLHSLDSTATDRVTENSVTTFPVTDDEDSSDQQLPACPPSPSIGLRHGQPEPVPKPPSPTQPLVFNKPTSERLTDQHVSKRPLNPISTPRPWRAPSNNCVEVFVQAVALVTLLAMFFYVGYKKVRKVL